MKFEPKEVAILTTDDADKLTDPDVINGMKVKNKPVIWFNHGLYRLIPKLQIEEFVRRYDQWKIASIREAATDKFDSAIHWDDCVIVDETVARMLLGEDSLEDCYKAGPDDS